jgi:hypothetical protein
MDHALIIAIVGAGGLAALLGLFLAARAIRLLVRVVLAAVVLLILLLGAVLSWWYRWLGPPKPTGNQGRPVPAGRRSPR